MMRNPSRLGAIKCLLIRVRCPLGPRYDMMFLVVGPRNQASKESLMAWWRKWHHGSVIMGEGTGNVGRAADVRKRWRRTPGGSLSGDSSRAKHARQCMNVSLAAGAGSLSGKRGGEQEGKWGNTYT